MVTAQEVNPLIDEINRAYEGVSPGMKRAIGSYVETLCLFVLNDTDHVRNELKGLFVEIEQFRKRSKRRLTEKENAFVAACKALQEKLGPIGRDPLSGIGAL